MKMQDQVRINRFGKIILLILAFQFIISAFRSDASFKMVGRAYTPFPSQETTGGYSLFNLSCSEINEHVEQPVLISRGKMYNFTCNNTGDASFHVTLASNASITDYITNKTNTEYSDEFLTMSGLPLWGDLDRWDNVEFPNFSELDRGISLSPGEVRSFIVYLDGSHETPILPATLLVILKSTTNESNNIMKITWDEVSLSSPDGTLFYSNEDSSSSIIVPPSTTSLVNITALNSANLTNSSLNHTITINGTLTFARWEKDLNGNVRRMTDVLNGNDDAIYVPAFLNKIIDGKGLPGFIINDNKSSNVEFNWTFSKVEDPTVSYENIGFNNATVDFNWSGENKAFRVLELASTSYFQLEFSGSPDISINYWNVGIEFIFLGGTAKSYSLNFNGENETENIKIFSVEENDNFSDVKIDFSRKTLKTFKYWLAGDSDLTPDVTLHDGSQYLGMIITANYSTTFMNYTCAINITRLAIEEQDDEENIHVGHEFGSRFDDFDVFHVRQFNFSDFAQYQWIVTSTNVTGTVTNKRLVCNNELTGDYDNDMNNALLSAAVNTSILSGNITLSFRIQAFLQNNDYLRVYIKNSSGTHELDLFTLVTPLQIKSYNITVFSDDTLQVIFNMTTNSAGSGLEGPYIDDILITNGTEIAFQDDFEGDLSKWTEIDNTGGGNYYWRIEGDTLSLNRPRVAIIYPNSQGTITGYPADSELYDGYVKNDFSNNPFIQSNHVGYIVITADSVIVQNFSVTVSKIIHEPIELIDGLKISSNISYYVPESGSFELLNDFHEYLFLEVHEGIEYQLTFKIDGVDIRYLDVMVCNEFGRFFEGMINDFYGFFQVNNTYIIHPSQDGKLFIKIAPIIPDLTIEIELHKLTSLEKFPWLTLLTVILGGMSAFTLTLLIYNRKVIKIPAIRKKVK
ncbi:MAG: hypothetical protein ACTSVI_02555 [Promethearchaeota archaeon]